MTTLTDVTQATRKIIFLTIIIGVIGTFLYLSMNYLKSIIPTPQPKPTPVLTYTIFNKLPKISFPEQEFPKDIKFSVETIGGGIPQASPSAKVYQIVKKQEGLLSKTKAEQYGLKIGFTSPGIYTDTQIAFSNNSGSTFIIDYISNNFTYNYDYAIDGTVFEGKNDMSITSATTVAQKFLTQLEALPKDYEQIPKSSFYTYNGQDFSPTAYLNEATVIRLDYFRKFVDQKPIATDFNNKGNLYVYVAKTQDASKQIIIASKIYQEISYVNPGIYPIKSSLSAWEDFLAGNGYIADFGNSKLTKKAVLRDAYIAYYDSANQLDYLMPIYVFTGDNGFMGYARAIDDEWVKE